MENKNKRGRVRKYIDIRRLPDSNLIPPLNFYGLNENLFRIVQNQQNYQNRNSREGIETKLVIEF